MNRSYSKLRHIQESNLKLEKRTLNEQRYLKHDKLNAWTSDDDTLRNFDTLPGEDSDYDEEEFDDFDTFSQKYPDSKSHSHGFSGQDPKDVFGMYKDKYGPLKVRTRKGMTEEQGPDEDYFEGNEDSRDLVSMVRDKLASLPNNPHKIKVLESIKSIIDMELKVIERQM